MGAVAIEIVKDSLPITEALEFYTNADLSRVRTNRRQFNVQCPLHEDRRPSLTVWTDSGRWKCWAGCGGGDVINLVALALEVSTSEAIRRIKTDFGLADPKGVQSNKLKTKVRERQTINEIENNFDKQRRFYMNFLLHFENFIDERISSVQTLGKAEEWICDLFHLKPQVNYWLDCLIEDDVFIQFETLKEIKRFFEGM